jgi:hypothetical protein
MAKEELEEANEIEALRKAYLGLIEVFANWACFGADYVGKEYGDEEVKRYLRYIGERTAVPMFKSQPGVALIKNIKGFQELQGGEGITYTEDDRKAAVSIERCGTGGRMKREGIVGGRFSDGTPWYCGHCKIWWEEIPQELGLGFNFEYGEEGPCTYSYTKRGSE